MSVHPLHGDFVPADTVRQLVTSAAGTVQAITAMVSVAEPTPGHWLQLGYAAAALTRDVNAIAPLVAVADEKVADQPTETPPS